MHPLWIRNYGSGDGDALLLAATHLRAPLAAQRVVLRRHALDKGVGVGHTTSLLYFLHRRAFLAVADIVEDGGGEEDGLLCSSRDIRQK